MIYIYEFSLNKFLIYSKILFFYINIIILNYIIGRQKYEVKIFS